MCHKCDPPHLMIEIFAFRTMATVLKQLRQNADEIATEHMNMSRSILESVQRLITFQESMKQKVKQVVL